ncbi:OmpA family protein [Portibacter marinus]|uniref:OmpA family protein n=1 Tax=Portibacter marinus TaxID=2898660 RepID=UPI001F1DA06C|nr:OmpA family protein [Portibacter marinus]
MNSKYFVLFLFFVPMVLGGQSIVTENNAPKALSKLYEKAQKCISENKVEEAIDKLEKALEKESKFIDAHLQLGGLLYSNQSYEQAIDHFKSAIDLDSTYNVRAYQALAQSYEASKNFQEAIDTYKVYLLKDKKIRPEYRNEVEKKIRDFEFRKYALANPLPFDPVMLPEAINSPNYSEYLPSLTADGQKLFFTRVTQNQEDIYYAEKDSLDNWTEAQLLPNLNTLENEGAHAISANGKTILFTFCSDGRNRTPRGCNIYAAFKKEGVWSRPTFFDAINSNAWDSQPSISADGEIIIFASKRPGGHGESDLWWSKRNEEGKWLIPQNLGPVINTPFKEESPFLHPDGKTLYFKSDGHPGMGSFDLFKSELGSDGQWSDPVNLGYPINTEDHEGAMIVGLDGKTAYYSKGSGTVGFDRNHTDIYTFELPKASSADPVGFVRINVYDAKTHNPLAARVDIQSSSRLARSRVTDSEGEVLVILPVGENFSINIDKENYYLHSERIELDNPSTSETAFEVNIYLKKVEPIVEADPEPVILKNVLFETGSFELLEESFFELNHLVDLLKENPDLKIEIRGHTDNVGPEEDNQLLSENRAKSVYEYLTRKGVQSERLSYRGLGESQPISTNETEEGRRLNRRTEFITVE